VQPADWRVQRKPVTALSCLRMAPSSLPAESGQFCLTLHQDVTQPLSMRPTLLMPSGLRKCQDPCCKSEEHAGPWMSSFQEAHTWSSRQQFMASGEAVPIQASSVSGHNHLVILSNFQCFHVTHHSLHHRLTLGWQVASSSYIRLSCSTIFPVQSCIFPWLVLIWLPWFACMRELASVWSLYEFDSCAGISVCKNVGSDRQVPNKQCW